MPINLADRIKELSYTIGTGNMMLSGPVRGFSSFSSTYSHNSEVFYAITDGTNYEIGSGIYQRADYDNGDGITTNQLVRFPIKSTNSNAKVNFVEGTKEVYVTYPATHSVYMGSGLAGLTVPQSSGIAFWGSDHVLDYDSSFVWDKTNNRLGINKTNPDYPIDVGGTGSDSVIRASGLIVSSSGIYFPSGNNGDVSYSGGRQLTHYIRNETDKYAYDRSLIGNLTGSDSVIQLSGSANQYILFKQQNAGLVFASPADTCSPPCGPAYPSFRPLVLADIPNLDSLYITESEWSSYSGILNNRITTVSGMMVSASGTLRNDLTTVSGALRNDLTTVSGTLRNDLTTVSGILTSASGLLYNNFVTISGIAVTTSGNLAAVSGYFQNKTQNISATGTLTYIGGSVGINYTPRNDSTLSIKQIATNSGTIYGNILDYTNIISVSGEYSNIGSYLITSCNVQNGIYNSGISIGSTTISQRNLTSSNDGGRLKSLYGANIAYGHNGSFAQSPLTTDAVGLSISCYALSGIIENAYDLVLADSGVNVNNHWGIFQTSPNNNYFAGNVGIGITQPTTKLDVNGDKIRLRTSKTPATATSTGNTGDICWDSNYMYICVSTNTWKRSAIATW
jgi:hypothetical protein